MIYCLYGENNYEINNFINKLIKDNGIDNKIVYDFNETNIEEVIEEASYNDLFGSNKIVILENADFLTGKSTLDNKAFDNYLTNPNENTILVLKSLTEKLDDRKKIVKTLKEKAVIKEFKALDEKNSFNFIKEYFESIGYKIDYNAISEIVYRINSNTQMLPNELEKLKLYKLETKQITLEDAKKVITKYESDDQIFKLVDSVINKDTANIFTIYKSLIELKNEPTSIIALLANQLRLILQVSILVEDGFTSKDIALKLKEHPYRVSLAMQNSYKISRKDIIKLLKSLSILDYKIKAGEIDKIRGLETFFLEV